MDLKIISYNVNGIRSAMRKGLVEWLRKEDPDLFLVQETKAQPEQVDTAAFAELGYRSYFHSAEKRGYSGVAIFTKHEPDRVVDGMGLNEYDSEGRVLRMDLGDFTFLSAYFPSGSSGELRQAFKMKFLDDFQKYASSLIRERPNTVISGDYNICHRPIDIHNPRANKNSSGFLPEEREWFSQFLDSGFIDSFRHYHPEEPHNYSWWTYRNNARQRNLGWRIDYHLVSQSLVHNLRGADILSNVFHSDHCPVALKIQIN